MTILKHIKIAGVAAALGLLTVTAPARAESTYNVASLADFTGPYADVMKDLIGARRPVIDWWNAEVGKKIGVKLGIKDYDHRYDAAQVASLWPGIKAELNPIILRDVMQNHLLQIGGSNNTNVQLDGSDATNPQYLSLLNHVEQLNLHG